MRVAASIGLHALRQGPYAPVSHLEEFVQLDLEEQLDELGEGDHVVIARACRGGL